MNGFGRSRQHDDDDDDDDDVVQEMKGLLNNSEQIDLDRNNWKKKVRNKHKQLQGMINNNQMKPLEIMHKSVELRFEESESGGGIENSSKAACRIGCTILVMGFAVGFWIWSGQEVSLNTGIERWKTFNLSSIRNWCLDKSHNCRCANPLEPQHRKNYKTWELAHNGNIRDALSANSPDVVLLGDSIVEAWRGMSFGKPVASKLPNQKVFSTLFDKAKGAEFHGLALGIAGDRTYNLLYRIQNGEIPDSLDPSVWWLVIGTNDFGRDMPHCSPEVVSLGIQRVVEEIHTLRPGAIIVVNSLLPRACDGLDGRLVDPFDSHHDTVYQGILEVNRRLRDYTSKYRNVYFFDANSIFIRQDEGIKGVDGMYIPQDLMSDYLHPTAEGYKLWGDDMVAKLHSFMDASTMERGRLPLPSMWWDKKDEGLLRTSSTQKEGDKKDGKSNEEEQKKGKKKSSGKL